MKLPHPITAFFNSIIVRLLKVLLFPGASIMKGHFVDAQRIAKSKEDLKAVGAESVMIKTADGDKLDCLYIDAEKFKKDMEKYLEIASHTYSGGTKTTIFRVKSEYCEEIPGKSLPGKATRTYRIPVPEAAQFLEHLEGIIGIHLRYEEVDNPHYKEYIIDIGEMPEAPATSSSSTALIVHGSGMSSSGYKRLAGEYLLRGINVMMVDLRGYGKSEGSPTDFRTKLDLDAAYQYLQTEKGVKNEELLVHAHCIGGGPATDLAARRPGVNILLDRTFSDYTDLAATQYPLISRLVRRILPQIIDYNSAKNLPKIQGHIAIEMDEGDSVIPQEQVTKLINNLPYRKGQRIKLMDSNMGHEGTWTHQEATKQQFDQFLQQIHFGRKLF